MTFVVRVALGLVAMALVGWITISAVTPQYTGIRATIDPAAAPAAPAAAEGRADAEAAAAPSAAPSPTAAAPSAAASPAAASTAAAQSGAATASAGGGNAQAGATRGGNAGLIDAGWAAGVSARASIPVRAVLGYAGAALAMQRQAPSCHIGWNTLAALGDVESGHGTHAGSQLNDAGVDTPGVFGPNLDGTAYQQTPDTDGGALDGTAAIDRAVGPLQFIPSTWATWGADGNGDGVADPQQIDDAALAAARYLCSYGDLSVPEVWRASVYAYNHVWSYVDTVASAANQYAAAAG